MKKNRYAGQMPETGWDDERTLLEFGACLVGAIGDDLITNYTLKIGSAKVKRKDAFTVIRGFREWEEKRAEFYRSIRENRHDKH